MVLVDTLRSDHLPSYGYGRDTAPFLAELADQGMQLQGYSASSWTRASVATLLTGLYPQRHQAVHRHDRLPAGAPYLPALLAGHGFHTASVTANGNVSSQFGFDRGYATFKERLGPGKPRAAQVLAEAAEVAEALRPRFFLYVHLIDPHDPYAPKRPWPAAGGQGRRGPLIEPQDILQGKVPMNASSLQRLRDEYDGEIAEMDQSLRRFVGELDAAGLLEGTLLVVTADHGEEFGEHGGLAHGATLFEEVVKVPFILWSKKGLPRAPRGHTFDLVDFTPTVLEALGFDPPEGLDGTARWQAIEAGEDPRPEKLFFHLELDDNSVLAVQEPPYKLIERNRSPRELFFDLDTDRAERSSLTSAGEVRSRLAADLRRKNSALLARAYPRETSRATAEVRAQLEALGYLKSKDEASPKADPASAKRP